MKRFFDIIMSSLGLVFALPILIPVIFLVWLQDKHRPFYVAPRVGLNETTFMMVKLRSMVVNAHKTGVDSTSANDKRITTIGKFIRKFKLDELTQLWNVLKGDMSLVGPRPNVERETNLYTHEEKKLLSVKPGITDFSSIVFSDEGDILKDALDPDITYNQLIRPGKSKLGIFYIQNQSTFLDLKLCFYTLVAIFSRKNALKLVTKTLQNLNADEALIQIAARVNPLKPSPPPGAKKIVTNRDGNPYL